MSVLATLAELAEYFKGWHTKYYDELHEKYASLDHPNEKATKNKYGHVKLTDNCTQYEDGLALSPSYACTANAKFAELQNEINKLKNDVTSIEPIRIKIGYLRDPQNRTLSALSSYFNSNLSNFEMSMANKTLGAWGATKVIFDAQWNRTADKLVIQLLETDGNPISTGKTIFIKINDTWYPRTTNDIGVALVNIDFKVSTVKNSIVKLQSGQSISDKEKQDIEKIIVEHCGKWRIMEVISNSNFNISKLENVNDNNEAKRFENTYNTISKKFLYIFGENLWDYAMHQPNLLQEADSVPELNVDTYNSAGTNANDLLSRSAIVKDGAIIGYKLFSNNNNTNGLEKQYYRYPKNYSSGSKYAYGYPANTDVNGSGF